MPSFACRACGLNTSAVLLGQCLCRPPRSFDYVCAKDRGTKCGTFYTNAHMGRGCACGSSIIDRSIGAQTGQTAWARSDWGPSWPSSASQQLPTGAEMRWSRGPRTVKLRIAIWNVNTNSSSLSSEILSCSYDTRLQWLADVVNVAREWLDSQQEMQPTLKMFVAPEGLFSQSRTKNNLDVTALREIQDRCLALSKGLLLLPGTVFWYKNLDRAKDAEIKPLKFPKRTVLTRSSKDEIKQSRLTKLQTRYTKMRSGRAQRIEEFRNKNPYAKLREGLFTDSIDAQLTQLEKKVDRLATVASNRRGRISRNTAFVYYDGAPHFKYHKLNEFMTRSSRNPTVERSGEVQSDDEADEPMEFVPGELPGCFVVPVGDVDVECGLEICQDHAEHALKDTLQDRPVHLHFLLSATTWIRPANVCSTGKSGYFIHADPDSRFSGVHIGSSESVKEPTHRVPMAKLGVLLFYDLDLVV